MFKLNSLTKIVNFWSKFMITVQTFDDSWVAVWQIYAIPLTDSKNILLWSIFSSSTISHTTSREMTGPRLHRKHPSLEESVNFWLIILVSFGLYRNTQVEVFQAILTKWVLMLTKHLIPVLKINWIGARLCRLIVIYSWWIDLRRTKALFLISN